MATATAKTGITRIRKGKGYSYHLHGRQITKSSQLDRIRALAIPPSWTDVWISPKPNAYLQATGIDMAGRKQYRYHPAWMKKRSERKFNHLLEFGTILPRLRRQVGTDIRLKEWNEKKVIAIAIRLLETSHIRVGSAQYEKLYKSYGLTTLEDKNVKIKKGGLELSFTGKKGIKQEMLVKDKKLASLIARCRDIPGKKLLQYYTPEGRHKAITSTQVNQYIQSACGNGFSAKDFRTWAGTVYALAYLQTNNNISSFQASEIQTMLQYVSTHLGNTIAICRKYYIHPCVMTLYEEGGSKSRPRAGIYRYLFGKTGLSLLEKSLLTLLKKQKSTD